MAVYTDVPDDELRAFKSELQKLRNRDLNRTPLASPLRIGERIPLTEGDMVS